MPNLFYSETAYRTKKPKLCTLLQTLGVVLAGSISAIGLNSAAALADTAAINSKQFTASAVNGHRTVRVISRGHERFDAIEDGGTLRVRVEGHVDPKRSGRVKVGGFLLGLCTASPNCSQFTMRYIESESMDSKRWNFEKTLFIPTDIITHDGPNGIAPYPDGNRLIDGCNSRMNGDGPVRNVKYITNMNISASAATAKWELFNNFDVANWTETYFGGDVGMADNFLVDVECVPSEELLSQPVSVTTRVEDLDAASPGSCPRTIQHFTSIYYYQPTNVRFNIKLNGEVVQSVEQSTVAELQNDGTTQHVLHHETEIDSPSGPNGYQVKIVGGGESAVKYYHVHCADFRVTSSHLQHEFTPNGECPRTVWQAAVFHTNGPGLVKYKIKHSSGIVFWRGEEEAQLFGDQYKAVVTRTFAPTDSVDWDLTAIPEDFETAQSGWTQLKLQCSHESDGEFTLDTSPQDDALNPVVATWDGEVVIADGNAPQGEYKRPAQVFFQVEREESGNFDYHISCSNGRSFQGSATSFNSGGSKWKAFGTHNFNMTRPMTLQCRLREVKANGKKVSIDKASFRFAGAVNPDLGGGNGELASPDQDNDNGLAPTKPMVGGFQLIDNGNAAKQNKCERSAQALVWFDAPKNDNIHYSLDCGELGNFSGVLQPSSIGNNRYRAGKIINYQVKKTIQAGCTLRTVSPGIATDHAFKSKTFQCVRSAGHDSGIGGVTTPARPQTKTAPVRTNPIKPKPKVAVCRGGKIRYGSCFCAKGTTRKKISRFEYLCKRDRIATPSKPEKPKKPVRVNPPKPKKVKEPVRTNPKPKKKKKLICVGGKVRGGKCSCGPNKLRKKIGKRKFQCIAVAKPPKPKKPVRANPKPKKKALICKGGKVRSGKCRCPKGRILKKQGKRKFLCFRPAG